MQLPASSMSAAIPTFADLTQLAAALAENYVELGSAGVVNVAGRQYHIDADGRAHEQRPAVQTWFARVRAWFTRDRSVRRRETSVSAVFTRAKHAMLRSEFAQCFSAPLAASTADAISVESLMTENPLFEPTDEPSLTPAPAPAPAQAQAVETINGNGVVEEALAAAQAAQAFACSASQYAERASASAEEAVACAERIAVAAQDCIDLMVSRANAVAQSAVVAADKAAASCGSAERAANMASSAATLASLAARRVDGDSVEGSGTGNTTVVNTAEIARSLAVLAAKATTDAEVAATAAAKAAETLASMEAEEFEGLQVTRL